MVIGVLVGTAVAEGIVRSVVPQVPSWLDIYRKLPGLPFYGLQRNLDRSCSTGETTFRVITDEMGFRTGLALDNRLWNSQTIWLGESYAFGQGVNYKDSFIGRVADSSDGRIHHLNTGVGGWGPVQYQLLLESLLESRIPCDRVVVASYIGNDFHDTLWDKNEPVSGGVLGARGDLRTGIKRRSHLYRLASQVWHRVGFRMEMYAQVEHDLESPECWATGILSVARTKFRRSLDAIAELCRTRGVPLYFLVIPSHAAVTFQRTGKVPPEGGDDPRLPVRKAMEIADGLGLESYDALEVLARYPTSETFFNFDGHLTPRGGDILASALITHWPALTGKL